VDAHSYEPYIRLYDSNDCILVLARFNFCYGPVEEEGPVDLI
jgi:hypothetical protein